MSGGGWTASDRRRRLMGSSLSFQRESSPGRSPSAWAGPPSPTGSPSEALQRRLRRLDRAKLYLLEQPGPHSFLLATDTPGHKYRVTLGPQVSAASRRRPKPPGRIPGCWGGLWVAPSPELFSVVPGGRPYARLGHDRCGSVDGRRWTGSGDWDGVLIAADGRRWVPRVPDADHTTGRPRDSAGRPRGVIEELCRAGNSSTRESAAAACGKQIYHRFDGAGDVYSDQTETWPGRAARATWHRLPNQILVLIT